MCGRKVLLIKLESGPWLVLSVSTDHFEESKKRREREQEGIRLTEKAIISGFSGDNKGGHQGKSIDMPQAAIAHL